MIIAPTHFLVLVASLLVMAAPSCPAQADPPGDARSSGYIPADILRRCGERADLHPSLKQGNYKIIYRFAALPTERYLRPYILTVAAKAALSPTLSSEADISLKVLETDDPKLIEGTSKLSADETQQLLTAVHRSEIFHLAEIAQPISEDDGGSYTLFTTVSSYTYHFERWTEAGHSALSRRSEESLPAREASAAFSRIADALFLSLQHKGK